MKQICGYPCVSKDCLFCSGSKCMNLKEFVGRTNGMKCTGYIKNDINQIRIAVIEAVKDEPTISYEHASAVYPSHRITEDATVRKIYRDYAIINVQGKRKYTIQNIELLRCIVKKRIQSLAAS